VAPAAAATDPPVPDDAAGQGIPAASELDTIDGLADALAVDPDQFGPRTVDVIEQLGDINGNGRAAQRQAASLLENAAGWVESGELSPAVLVMVEPLLLPLIERGGGEGNGNGDDEDDDEDDGDD